MHLSGLSQTGSLRSEAQPSMWRVSVGWFYLSNSPLAFPIHPQQWLCCRLLSIYDDAPSVRRPLGGGRLFGVVVPDLLGVTRR